MSQEKPNLQSISLPHGTVQRYGGFVYATHFESTFGANPQRLLSAVLVAEVQSV